jgi:hypothetical protein
MALYDDKQLWSDIRDNALAKIRSENNREGYVSRLSEILSLLFK